MKEWETLAPAERSRREEMGKREWMKWVERHHAAVVTQGGPLGKTKRVDPAGLADIRNHMVAFVVVKAESHEAAAKMFVEHPHFSIFPGEAVEVMECLPVPTVNS